MVGMASRGPSLTQGQQGPFSFPRSELRSSKPNALLKGAALALGGLWGGVLQQLCKRNTSGLAGELQLCPPAPGLLLPFLLAAFQTGGRGVMVEWLKRLVGLLLLINLSPQGQFGQ